MTPQGDVLELHLSTKNDDISILEVSKWFNKYPRWRIMRRGEQNNFHHFRLCLDGDRYFKGDQGINCMSLFSNEQLWEAMTKEGSTVR